MNNTFKQKQPTKAISLVLPLGLYNRIIELATKSRLNPHAYCVRTLWRTTDWDGATTPNTPTITKQELNND